MFSCSFRFIKLSNELADNTQHLVNQHLSSSQPSFFSRLPGISISLHGHPLPLPLLTCSSLLTCINKHNFWILLRMMGGGGLLTTSDLVRSSAWISNCSLEETHQIIVLQRAAWPSLLKKVLHKWQSISCHFSDTSSSSAATWGSSW